MDCNKCPIHEECEQCKMSAIRVYTADIAKEMMGYCPLAHFDILAAIPQHAANLAQAAIVPHFKSQEGG